jgi:hypothetical protein
MAAEVEQETEVLFGAAAVEEPDLEAVETALRRRALRLAARLLEARLNADFRTKAVPPGRVRAAIGPATWGGEPSVFRVRWES